MGGISSPKIHPTSGTPFVDCRGVTEMMGLSIFLDDFPVVTTEVGFLVEFGVSASYFRPQFASSFPGVLLGQVTNLWSPWLPFAVHLGSSGSYPIRLGEGNSIGVLGI
jgi:hypothetical protein